MKKTTLLALTLLIAPLAAQADVSTTPAPTCLDTYETVVTSLDNDGAEAGITVKNIALLPLGVTSAPVFVVAGAVAGVFTLPVMSTKAHDGGSDGLGTLIGMSVPFMISSAPSGTSNQIGEGAPYLAPSVAVHKAQKGLERVRNILQDVENDALSVEFESLASAVIARVPQDNAGVWPITTATVRDVLKQANEMRRFCPKLTLETTHSDDSVSEALSEARLLPNRDELRDWLVESFNE